MLNAPKQTLKPSNFGCQVRKNTVDITGTSAGVFAYGWGVEADDVFSSTDAFYNIETLSSDEFIIPAGTKKLRIYIQGIPGNADCRTVKEINNNYCQIPECPEGSSCCSPCGVCCLTDNTCFPPSGTITAYECGILGGSFLPGAICDQNPCQPDKFHCCEDNCLSSQGCTDPNCKRCVEVEENATCTDGSSPIKGECQAGVCPTSGCANCEEVCCCSYTSGVLDATCTSKCRSDCDTGVCGDGSDCSDNTGCSECDPNGPGGGNTVNCCSGAPDYICTARCECQSGESAVGDCDLDCVGATLDKFLCVSEPGVPGECLPSTVGFGSLNECQEFCIDDSVCCCFDGECRPPKVGEIGCSQFLCVDCPRNCGEPGLPPSSLLYSVDSTNSLSLSKGMNAAFVSNPKVKNPNDYSSSRVQNYIKSKVPSVAREIGIEQTSLSFTTAVNDQIQISGFAGATCDVCNRQGCACQEDCIGEHVVSCPALETPGAIIEYDLSNLCETDQVTVKTTKTLQDVTIQISTNTSSTPLHDIFEAIIVTRSSGNILSGSNGLTYDCEGCTFEAVCQPDINRISFVTITDGVVLTDEFAFDEITVGSLEKLSSIKELFIINQDQIPENAKRKIIRDIKYITQSFNKEIYNPDTLTIIPEPNIGDSSIGNSVAEQFINNSVVAKTRELSGGVDGRFVANTSLTGPYGISCGCDGCDSGLVRNPPFLGVAGIQGFTMETQGVVQEISFTMSSNGNVQSLESTGRNIILSDLISVGSIEAQDGVPRFYNGQDSVDYGLVADFQIGGITRYVYPPEDNTTAEKYARYWSKFRVEMQKNGGEFVSLGDPITVGSVQNQYINANQSVVPGAGTPFAPGDVLTFRVYDAS